MPHNRTAIPCRNKVCNGILIRKIIEKCGSDALGISVPVAIDAVRISLLERYGASLLFNDFQTFVILPLK